MAVLKGGTYAKKGKETSHRNPKAGHMQKKGEGTSHRNPKTGHNQKENLHMSQQKENCLLYTSDAADE